MNGINIRAARDVDAQHICACAQDELDVGGVEGNFPDAVAVSDSIRNDDLWLVAEHYGSIVGFIHASVRDGDRGTADNHACVVYASVILPHQNTGVGAALLECALGELKRAGIDYVYAWAHPTSGAVEFMEKHGFSRGKSCVWMDRRL